jgi:hypothetical protein
MSVSTAEENLRARSSKEFRALDDRLAYSRNIVAKMMTLVQNLEKKCLLASRIMIISIIMFLIILLQFMFLFVFT